MVFIDKFYRVYSPYNAKHKATERSAASNKTTLNLNDNNWDALKYKISNVRGGNQPDDVSTIAQTLTRKDNVFIQGKQKFNLMETENNNWNAKKQKISNLSEASEPNDAVILKQTLVRKKDDSSFVQGKNKYNFLELKDGKCWDAGNQVIENVKPGVSATQAATICQIPIETTDWWDFKGKKISNVTEGINPCDGAIMRQVISLNDEDKFNAKGKKITNICPGDESGDVATTDQLIKKVGIGKFTLDGAKISLIQKDDKYNVWDGRKKKISNVMCGEDDSDVATVGQLFKRVGGNVVSNNGEQFSILQLNNDTWDCKNIRVAQVQEGVDDNDACIIKQLKDLKNIFPNLLVADPEVGLKTLDGQAYKPHGFVYHNEKGNIFNSEGLCITCSNNVNMRYGN